MQENHHTGNLENSAMHQQRAYAIVTTFIACIAFLIDRFVKSLVIRLPESSIAHTWGIIGIEPLHNQHVFIWIPVNNAFLVGISTIVLAGVIVLMGWFLAKRNYHSFFPLFVVFLGGVSNYVDRLAYESTIDYIRVGSLVGNIADILIIVGIFWLIQKQRYTTHIVSTQT